MKTHQFDTDLELRWRDWDCQRFADGAKLGIQTPLQPYATTALGASEVTLMELANAYRSMASGVLPQPCVIRRIVLDSGQVMAESEHASSPVHVEGSALLLIQEGMRSVVRLPIGTAHALDSGGFPIAAMGKMERQMSSGTRSSWAPLTARQGLRLQCVSVLTTIVLWERKKLAAGSQFPAEIEQDISAYLEGGDVKTITQR